MLTCSMHFLLCQRQIKVLSGDFLTPATSNPYSEQIIHDLMCTFEISQTDTKIPDVQSALKCHSFLLLGHLLLVTELQDDDESQGMFRLD